MNEKISAMPDIVTLNGSDIVPVVRSGDMTNYRASLKEIATFVGSTADGIFVNSTTVSQSYTIAPGFNGYSTGPMTIAPGVTVTVSSGQRWLVL